jgi:hypothetical protein
MCAALVLTCLAAYVTVLSVLPVEVVPPIVRVEEPTWLLSADSGAKRLVADLEIEVSKALGVSLSKVDSSGISTSDWPRLP